MQPVFHLSPLRGFGFDSWHSFLGLKSEAIACRRSEVVNKSRVRITNLDGVQRMR